MGVFAVGAITSGLALLFLPETKGKELPSTLAEAEELGSSTTLQSSHSTCTEEEQTSSLAVQEQTSTVTVQ